MSLSEGSALCTVFVMSYRVGALSDPLRLQFKPSHIWALHHIWLIHQQLLLHRLCIQYPAFLHSQDMDGPSVQLASQCLRFGGKGVSRLGFLGFPQWPEYASARGGFTILPTSERQRASSADPWDFPNHRSSVRTQTRGPSTHVIVFWSST